MPSCLTFHTAAGDPSEVFMLDRYALSFPSHQSEFSPQHFHSLGMMWNVEGDLGINFIYHCKSKICVYIYLFIYSASSVFIYFSTHWLKINTEPANIPLWAPAAPACFGITSGVLIQILLGCPKPMSLFTGIFVNTLTSFIFSLWFTNYMATLNHLSLLYGSSDFWVTQPLFIVDYLKSRRLVYREWAGAFF